MGIAESLQPPKMLQFPSYSKQILDAFSHPLAQIDYNYNKMSNW